MDTRVGGDTERNGHTAAHAAAQAEALFGREEARRPAGGAAGRKRQPPAAAPQPPASGPLDAVADGKPAAGGAPGEGRGEGGRFVAGNRFGRGNPHARKLAELRAAVLDVVGPE